MATTESGWPVLTPGSALLRQVHIPTEVHRSVNMTLRWGTPALLLPHLIMCFDDRVENVDGPVVDDWGYAFRAVRGYDAKWSDHAGGEAVDINATQHPLGRRGTFTKAEHAAIEELINLPRYRHQGKSVFYWGGNYHSRADEMHFGLQLPLARCEAVARELLDSPRGKLIVKANPGLKKKVLS